jgi:hypothetical protein
MNKMNCFDNTHRNKVMNRRTFPESSNATREKPDDQCIANGTKKKHKKSDSEDRIAACTLHKSNIHHFSPQV